MSSENDDSLKYDLSATDSLSIDNQVINKCLSEPQSAEHRNEIPCCSNDFNVSVLVEEDVLNESDGEEKVTEFIVIDLTCDVNNESKADSKAVNCDNLCIDLDSSQSLVPVHNEMVRSDSQKLVSLSLSILLAALLQAMQCFAQFLEDIVVPQRQ
ncbi:hypothetical protein O0L34_g5459 [Tuta absoluta]|nr:hypothetical protein O0L34_g5459 [Tuta absoluta]